MALPVQRPRAVPVLVDLRELRRWTSSACGTCGSAAYDAAVISSRFGNPRRLLVIACAVAALAVAALSWYATQTVRSDCVVAISKLTDGDGNTLPDADGRVWSDKELVDRAYEQAVDSGRCDPPRARWKQWLG